MDVTFVKSIKLRANILMTGGRIEVQQDVLSCK